MKKSIFLVSVLVIALVLGSTSAAADIANHRYTVTTSAGDYDVALYMAEIYTDAASGQLVRTVYFSDRGNRQLAGDFVPALSLDGTTNITYYVDDNRPTADLPVATSNAAVNRAMATWDAQTCSQLGMTQVPYDGRATGFVSTLFGYGGSFNYVADVVHAGWLPGAFFDQLAAGGGNFILGVTFTIIFTDSSNNPIDTDNNGKYDVAWREIYYNDRFTWADGSTYDVETVALHEAGHGLSQAHSGEAFRDPGSNTLHFDPRAVMNAAYSGVQTTITATDNAGHCSNWAQWPMN